jgi:hypothetical protein
MIWIFSRWIYRGSCFAERIAEWHPHLRSNRPEDAKPGGVSCSSRPGFSNQSHSASGQNRSDVKSAFSCAPTQRPPSGQTRPICSDEFADIDGRSFFGCSGIGSRKGMAEGEGFEPPLPVRVKRFSRPPVSTTHTSLREWRCSLMIATRLAKAKEGLRCSQP